LEIILVGGLDYKNCDDIFIYTINMTHIKRFNEEFIFDKMKAVTKLIFGSGANKISHENKKDLNKYGIETVINQDKITFNKNKVEIGNITFADKQPDRINTYLVLNTKFIDKKNRKFVNLNNCIKYFLEEFGNSKEGRPLNKRFSFK
jgi:hypothetical protein